MATGTTAPDTGRSSSGAARPLRGRLGVLAVALALCLAGHGAAAQDREAEYKKSVVDLAREVINGIPKDEKIALIPFQGPITNLPKGEARKLYNDINFAMFKASNRRHIITPRNEDYDKIWEAQKWELSNSKYQNYVDELRASVVVHCKDELVGDEIELIELTCTSKGVGEHSALFEKGMLISRKEIPIPGRWKKKRFLYRYALTKVSNDLVKGVHGGASKALYITDISVVDTRTRKPSDLTKKISKWIRNGIYDRYSEFGSEHHKKRKFNEVTGQDPDEVAEASNDYTYKMLGEFNWLDEECERAELDVRLLKTGSRSHDLPDARAHTVLERRWLSHLSAGTKCDAAGATAIPTDSEPEHVVATTPAEIVLANGYSVADWVLLAETRLKPGKYTELLVEVNRHIREHGSLELLEKIRDRAVAGLLAEIRFSTKDGARKALKRLDLLVASAGERPNLLQAQARAHRLLGDHASEAAAYEGWLLAAPQSHPERLDVLQALEQARQAVGEIARFEELLGRSFSVDAVEESVGWTDLHTAALLDLPTVVAALIEGGMSADVRLEEEGRPRFGDGLQRTLAALPKGEAFEGWHADGETPLMIAAVANARQAAEALIAGRAGVDTKNSKNGGQPLYYAARNDARDTAELLLAKGANIKATDSDGETPLHHAARKDARETAELLLAKGANIKATDNNGNTPLHHAALGNAHAIAELLLDRGGDIGATNNIGSAPLHQAAWNDARETAELLLAKGANIKATDSDGETPLHHAARKDARDTAELLLAKGANIKATDSDGETPLHHAARKDARETAELLLAKGANIKATDNNGNTPLHHAALGNAHAIAELLLDRGGDIGATNNIGSAPLHQAAWNDARETAELLLAKGANIKATDSDGETPLHHAARKDARETAELLLAKGANIKATDNNGYTPLHLAAMGNAHAIAELLLDRGGDIGTTNNSGYTPLHVAAWKNARETAELLLAKGANTKATDNNGYTPLHLAAWKNARETAELLLDRRADIGAANNNGSTPLHYAAGKDARETAELLLDRGANIEARDNDGSTPLHYAALGNARATAELLLDRDAQVNAIDNDGWTPLDYLDGGAESHAVMNDLLRRKGGLTGEEVREEQSQHERDALLHRLGIRHLGRPFSADARDDSVGWTDLHFAALLNLPDAVDALIDAGVAADVRLEKGTRFFGSDLRRTLAGLGHEDTFEGWWSGSKTPLMIAAVANARATAELLLDRRADIGATDNNGQTPLHYAAMGNARATAELLLDRDAGIGATNNYGNTPLHLAVRSNARATAELLLDRGAQVNATDNHGSTPLDYLDGDAESHAAMNDLLRRKGGLTGEEVRKEQSQHERDALLYRLGTRHLGRPFSADARDDSVGWTDLHFAALLNLPDAVDALIDAGMEVDARLEEGTRALGAELRRTLAKLRLKDTFEGWWWSGSQTPLMIAARVNALDAVKALVDREADIMAKGNEDQTPLHLAVWDNAWKTVELLLAEGANIEARDNDGSTPLHYAAWGDSPETAKLLLAERANIEARNNDGSTPLHYAAVGNSPKTAELLLAEGANIEARNNDGSTPLHIAAIHGARETAELLVSKDAAINATSNYFDETPLDAAIRTGKTSMQALLRHLGGKTFKDTIMDRQMFERHHETKPPRDLSGGR